MRITPFMVFDQLTKSLQNNLNDYATLNERLATTKKINKPSDDVFGLSRAMDYSVSLSANNQYSRNIDEASSQLNYANTVLSTISSTLQQVKQNAVSGMNGSLDATNQAILVKNTSQLRDQLLSLGNSQFRGRYIFSGFRTNQNAFTAGTYAYQGDAGSINAQIDKNAALPVNVPGSTVFSYTLSAPDVVQLSSGQYVHYTPGAGTTVNVEIRDTDNTTVLDTFNFSNAIQMTDTLSSAIAGGNALRTQALIKPLQNILQQVTNVQADVGAWMSRLDDQTSILSDSNLTLKNSLSNVIQDNATETAAELKQSETVLTALRQSSANILSNSLLDFIK
jgi:flagellar hook-associated protein 3 FlgL